jgi:hypothetical protein
VSEDGANHMVEILLPLRDNKDAPYPTDVFNALRDQLVSAFGGVTVFSRSPGEGLWRDKGAVSHDDVVVFEVMVASLDRPWWARLRRSLERKLRQKEIVIRAHRLERL